MEAAPGASCMLVYSLLALCLLRPLRYRLSVPAQYTSFTSGNLYINVHSAQYPYGEQNPCAVALHGSRRYTGARLTEPHHYKEDLMLGTILLIVLILMLIGAIPTWPHSKNWGYGPSGGLGLVVIIIIVLLLLGLL